MTFSNQSETPWRRVFQKFGMPSQAEFARALGKHRSKISRALKDRKGLINGRDQELLLKVSAERNIVLKPDDLMPGAQ